LKTFAELASGILRQQIQNPVPWFKKPPSLFQFDDIEDENGEEEENDAEEQNEEDNDEEQQENEEHQQKNKSSKKKNKK